MSIKKYINTVTFKFVELSLNTRFKAEKNHI